MRLSLLEILEATGGGEVGGTQVGETFSTFHTDSREVQQGGVFFALRGQEMDGSGFIGDAVARGAAAVVVERRTDVAAGVVEVVVPDTWTALYALASHALRRVQPLVIAVTGSNGKTSTKEMVAAILSRHFNVLSTQGNLNTETGVPLTILGLEPHHSALVLEMGMQRPGDIGRLAALARPVIGIVTNVGIVHIEFFNSREELARAKGELVAALPEAGLAVLNADNEFYPLLVQMTSARVAGFGIEAGDFRVEGYETLSDGGCRFTVRGVEVRLRMDGRHQALNAAAALAACDFAGVPVEAGAEALAGVVVEHRLQEVQAPAGFTLIDDAYNASPESMLAAFDAVAEAAARVPRRGRLLAVLGEMRELGPLSEESHRRIGQRAAEVFDAVCVVDGERARIMAQAAGAELVPDREGAAGWVRRNATEGDRVLVKGSHGVRLDELVKDLTAG
jgi:UDP-N-acetylmuramoyl-tripeptide--D-alanyl-D-alanine ligase